MFSPPKESIWCACLGHVWCLPECNSSELNEAGVKERCICWDPRRRRRSNFPLRYLNMMPPINHTLPRCLSLPSPIRTARTIMRQMGLSKSNSTAGVQ